MFSPEMISGLVKLKLDELLNGTYPEGLVFKEKTEKKLVFSLQDPTYEGVSLNYLSLSVTYNDIEIVVENGSK